MKYKELKSYHNWSINCYKENKFIGEIDRVLDYADGGNYFYYRFIPSVNGSYGRQTDGIKYKSVEDIKLKLESNEKTN